MAKYLTRQRKSLLAYLAEHADESISAGEATRALARGNVSASAVYRNLAQLEREGKISRSSRPGSQEAYYRYTDAEPCRGQVHLACLRCGMTRHMERADADRLAERLTETEDFALDRAGTILYGVCAECRNKGERG